MELRTLTFEDFMGGRVVPSGEAPLVPIPALIQTLHEDRPWLEPIEFMQDPNFATAVANRGGFSSQQHQVLLANENGVWRIVGGYIDDTLAIEQRYQGRGLSTELILRCSTHRPKPNNPRQVTIAGYRALLRAYLTGVRRAMSVDPEMNREVRAELLERISELREISIASGSDKAYFKSDDDKLTNPFKRPKFVEWEAEFLRLDESAWNDLKKKFKAALTSKDGGLRGWQQLFDIANEAKGYNYLSGIGCTDIKFVPVSKKNRKRSPDLAANLDGRRVLAEVKTINKSDEELARIAEGRAGAVTLQLDERLFEKINAAIAEATSQLRAFDEGQSALQYIFLKVHFDENVECQGEYRNQVENYISTIVSPKIVPLD